MHRFAALTLWCLACGLGSGAQAAAPVTAVDRWLAVGDASAAARARLFEMSRRAVPLCPEGAVWSLGESPFFVLREAPKAEVAQQVRDIVMREFAAQPGEYVFTHEPGTTTPFGAVGAHRADRLVAVDAGRWNVLEELRDDSAAGAGKRSYRDVYGEIAAGLAARPERRFALRRGAEELPVMVTAVPVCNVGFDAVDSEYSYADGWGNDVFVTLPLLATLRDDELTMVLANEFARVLLKQTRPLGTLLGIGKVAPFATLLNAGANRELDVFPPPNADLVAADRLTLWILRSYGIAPAAYLQFLERMESLGDPRPKATYARTRPLTPDRAAALREAAASGVLRLPKGITLDKVRAVVALGDTGVAPGRRAGAERSREHRGTPPPPSGFASADEVDRVPVRAEGKERFRHYLTLPTPKAFFVYASGGWRFWSGADAIAHGIEFCEREQRRCWVYAVDNDVVWQADESLRTGSRPLPPATAEETLR